MPTPLEVYNKRIKKKEKEKRKKLRYEVRASKKLLEDPENLKKELDELTHKAIIGRIDQDSLERKEKIEKLWEQYTKTKHQKDLEENYQSQSSDDSHSSSDSEESSDDEKPKCIIEIAGETKKKPVERRGFHDPETPNDEFAKELFNNIPKLQTKDEGKTTVKGNMSKRVKYNKSNEDNKTGKMNYTPRPSDNTIVANIPYTLNPTPLLPAVLPPVPPPPQFPMVNLGPIPPHMNMFPPPMQPPPMMFPNPSVGPQSVTHNETEEPAETKEKIPLSKYFVPSQLRLNVNILRFYSIEISICNLRDNYFKSVVVSHTNYTLILSPLILFHPHQLESFIVHNLPLINIYCTLQIDPLLFFRNKVNISTHPNISYYFNIIRANLCYKIIFFIKSPFLY
ncbi:uncharacterized protein TA20895 [Theileria annulata]|uniref:Wbp11/ELF5/Saf1 N-terminal domain-containing protein n=1 Tax=Theileria annulata TaxID=5874 RepID=Q4UGX6_THEAN|nr:uncharacterized protein TA20895 [Theileria annulata]CAI73663.1 hypothetical protein TA20895 [Theileria annulata]|eukprot:XP_954340.1 hypothetical protein TA20895 [Theileria annulata]